MTGLLCVVGTAVAVQIMSNETKTAPMNNTPFCIRFNPKNIMD